MMADEVHGEFMEGREQRMFMHYMCGSYRSVLSKPQNSMRDM